jgi:hypothetical protein
MADTAVVRNDMTRNGTATTYAWSTSLGGMTTGNTYLIPFAEDDKLGFFLSWNACETDTCYAIGVKVYQGDQWRGGIEGGTALKTTETGTYLFQPFVLWTTSCGRHEFGPFGPFESAQFGTESTTTSYGAELNEMYLKVGFIDSSSSGGGFGITGSSGAASTAVLDPILIRAFKWPSVVYST